MTSWDQNKFRRRKTRRRHTPLPITLLLIALAFPVELSITVGSLLITASRAVLLAFAFPSLFRFFKRGRLYSAELCLLGYAIWTLVSYSVNNGVGVSIERGGILSLEAIVGYMIVRLYISDLYKYKQTIKLLLLIVMVLMPLVVIESVTGNHFIHTFFNKITGYYYSLSYEERLGLTRAYGPFSHPILMGVFSSVLIGLVWYLWDKSNPANKLFRVGVIITTTFMSLSSAPFLVVLFSFFAIIWNRLAKPFKQKWQIAMGGFLSLYVFLLFWSPYNPLLVILGKITLNHHTAYYRGIVWDYGTAEVIRHPIFGIGLNDWVRPGWMIHTSIDTFWLREAMLYGFPGIILLSLGTLLLIGKVVKCMRRSESGDYILACKGWLVSIVAFVMVGFTVDFFGTIRIFFFFFLGIGGALIKISTYTQLNYSKRL